MLYIALVSFANDFGIFKLYFVIDMVFPIKMIKAKRTGMKILVAISSTLYLFIFIKYTMFNQAFYIYA
jgi:hypothetical protein